MDSNLNGKSLSKQFCPAIQPSSQPDRTETDYVKGYFTPPPYDLWKSGEEPQHSTPCVGNTPGWHVTQAIVSFSKVSSHVKS